MYRTNLGFRRTFPNQSNFSEHIRVKKLEDWNVEYVKLSGGIGYWIADNPFYDDGMKLYRRLVRNFPIVGDTNYEECDDANPFATIHLPGWCCVDLFNLFREYFSDHFPTFRGVDCSEWGNLYFPEDYRPWDYFRLPHMDGPDGIVGNLWFTDHKPGTTGTMLYRYHGEILRDSVDNKMYYEHQVNPDHPRFEDCKDLSQHKKRLPSLMPLTVEEETYWGFERVGLAPAIKNKITFYSTEVSHTPFIDKTVGFRWSHAYQMTRL